MKYRKLKRSASAFSGNLRAKLFANKRCAFTFDILPVVVMQLPHHLEHLVELTYPISQLTPLDQNSAQTKKALSSQLV
jgi:hypothetical protein